MPPADRIVGYDDIAAITGKSRRTIRRWFKLKRLRRVNFAGVVGVWESELIVALDWRGGLGGLVTDDCHGDDEASLDDLPDDVGAGVV